MGTIGWAADVSSASTTVVVVVFRFRPAIPPVGMNVVQTWCAAGQRRETLDVDAEQAGEGVGLGLAEGRELARDLLDRAVALAQLDAGERARADRSGRGGEAVLGERVDEGVGPRGGVGAGGVEPSGIPLSSSATRPRAKSSTAAWPACSAR